MMSSRPQVFALLITIFAAGGIGLRVDLGGREPPWLGVALLPAFLAALGATALLIAMTGTPQSDWGARFTSSSFLGCLSGLTVFLISWG